MADKTCRNISDVQEKYKVFHKVKAMDNIAFYLSHLQEQESKKLKFEHFKVTHSKKQLATSAYSKRDITDPLDGYQRKA